MKRVNPDTGSATTTLTERLAALAPRRDDLLDASLLSGLTMVALAGFHSTFDSYWYLVVGSIGVVLGLALSHLANVLRWHWLLVGVLVLVAFFVLGGTVALRADLIAGFVPSLTTLADLVLFGVGGWKDLLTTVPPVDGSGPYLVLPYLFGLVSSAAGLTVARRTKGMVAFLVVPLAALALSLALGTYEPAALAAQSLGFTALTVAWLTIRFARLGTISRSGKSRWLRGLAGALILAVALASGFVTGPKIAPVSDRFVLRSIVQPPLNLAEYPSPLAGFRKYSSSTKKLLFEQPLLKVSGAKAGDLLRIASLDTYTGTTWSAARDLNSGDNGFRRIGSKVPNPPAGDVTTIELTVLAAYASNIDLNIWVPALGPVTQVGFSPTTEKSHAAQLRYNLSTGQAVVPDRLTTDETLSVHSIPMVAAPDQDQTPGGPPTVLDADTEVVAQALERLAPKEGSAWKRLSAVMAALQSGAWSDGTRAGEGKYLPGHSVARLTRFVKEQPFVGSDEQYAATLGLMANRIGFPARVVFGANMPPSGEIQGKDITAWVEIFTAESGWVTIAPAQFMPNRDKHPEQQPQVQKDPESSVVVPPPNPQRPPGSFDSVFGSDLSADQLNTGLWGWFLRLVMMMFRVVGPPLLVVSVVVGGLLGAKAWRRARRRKRGTPSTQVIGGWRELVDRTRDLGYVVPRGWTRSEQAALVADPQLTRLAMSADAAVFARDRVDDVGAQDYWTQVAAVRRDLVADLPWWRRWWTALNPKSLLPSR